MKTGWQKGFTIVEVLVALLVASLAVVTLVSVYSSVVSARKVLERNGTIERLVEAAESIENILQRSGKGVDPSSNPEVDEVLSSLGLGDATIVIATPVRTTMYDIVELTLIATRANEVYRKSWKVVVGDLKP